mmetsp:Transcript_466/g.514  ORF Transcript_466/g.514 Transcript_466/m.514 type:complete len:112 (+) Transcript_466:273-608(+)
MYPTKQNKKKERCHELAHCVQGSCYFVCQMHKRLTKKVDDTIVSALFGSSVMQGRPEIIYPSKFSALRLHSIPAFILPSAMAPSAASRYNLDAVIKSPVFSFKRASSAFKS